jgi:tryptophan synthase alpha chain
VSVIGEAFARSRREKRAAFIPFLMAGHPHPDVTADLLAAAAAGGADVIELGVPFSDPIADGPVNQRAAARALAAGTHLDEVLRIVSAHRERLAVPIVLFTYYNPLLARGPERFAEQAAASGVDGVLCVDLPPEEAEEELLPALRAEGLDSIFLLAPTSSKERVRKVREAASGFVYYVSRTGVTGEREELPRELGREVKKLRKQLDLPLAVGFGLSTADQVAAVGRMADGVVVGSALVRLVEEYAGHPQLASLLEERVRELTACLGGRRS